MAHKKHKEKQQVQFETKNKFNNIVNSVVKLGKTQNKNIQNGTIIKEDISGEMKPTMRKVKNN